MRKNLKQTWDDFCDELKLLGEVVSNQKDLSEVDQVEGYRYLTRLLRLALEMNIEHSSSSHPSFYSLSHETAKIGADNPDNIYLNSNINGACSYEVFGNIGQADYLSFGLKENRYSIDGTMASMGEIDISEMLIQEDGSFTLTLGPNQSSQNYLHLPTSVNMLIVRQTYSQRQDQKHALIHIKNLAEGKTPSLLTAGELSQHLANSLAFVRGTAGTFLAWVNDFKTNHRNALPLGDQTFFQAAGGDPKIFYLHGYYDFNASECLEIISPIPECEFWNFQLENYWMESLDYRHNPIHLNAATAHIDQYTNTVKIIVSHHKLNIENNVITEGRNNGAMLLRWIDSKNCPIPTVTVKPINELETNHA